MLKTPVDFFKPPAGAVSYSDLRKATSAARSAAASPLNRSRAPAPSPPCSSIACSSVVARPSWRKCSAPRRSRSGSVRKSAGVARPRQMSAKSAPISRSEEHTSELQSQSNLVCRLLLEKKKHKTNIHIIARPTCNDVTCHTVLSELVTHIMATIHRLNILRRRYASQSLCTLESIHTDR